MEEILNGYKVMAIQLSQLQGDSSLPLEIRIVYTQYVDWKDAQTTVIPQSNLCRLPYRIPTYHGMSYNMNQQSSFL